MFNEDQSFNRVPSAMITSSVMHVCVRRKLGASKMTKLHPQRTQIRSWESIDANRRWMFRLFSFPYKTKKSILNSSSALMNSKWSKYENRCLFTHLHNNKPFFLVRTISFLSSWCCGNEINNMENRNYSTIFLTFFSMMLFEWSHQYCTCVQSSVPYQLQSGQ